MRRAIKFINPEDLAPYYHKITTQYKRHTLYRTNLENSLEGVQRLSAIESVWKFTQEIMPKIQKNIEQKLLDQYLEKETNEVYIKEIRDAYNQRQNWFEINKPKKPDMSPPPPEEPRWTKTTFLNALDGRGLRYHTQNDIGTYTYFPPEVFRKLFPYDLFGTYYETEYVYTKDFSLMCREDGLKLAAEFSNHTLPHERKLVNYNELIHECAKDMKSPKFKELINQDEYFRTFYYDFCLDLIDIYNGIKYKDPLLRQILEAPQYFDSMITILVKELARKPIKLFILHKKSRIKIMQQFLDGLKQEIIAQKVVPTKFSDIIPSSKFIKVKLDYNDLKDVLKAEEIPQNLQNRIYEYRIDLKHYHKFCDHLWRPEETRKSTWPRFKGFNTGALLWGPRGVGKSQIAAYLGAWAFDNNWASIMVPSGRKLVRGNEKVVQHSCGLYMQPETAMQILTGIQRTNADLFAEIPVNLNLYGKCNLAGWHDNEGPAIIRDYDTYRESWSDYWKTLFTEEQHKIMDKEKAKYDLRLSKVLPEPKNLQEIANYGVKDQIYATACIAEILEQLYNTDKCNVMIVSDDYNEWFDASEISSFQYHYKKEYKESIPPYDIALVRMFQKFNGHLIRNGVKVAATTQTKYFNHICTPEKINFPDGYTVEVQPLALNDFRNACKYYNYTMWSFKRFREWEVESYYTMSQGNWNAFQHSILNVALTKV